MSGQQPLRLPQLLGLTGGTTAQRAWHSRSRSSKEVSMHGYGYILVNSAFPGAAPKRFSGFARFLPRGNSNVRAIPLRLRICRGYLRLIVTFAFRE